MTGGDCKVKIINVKDDFRINIHKEDDYGNELSGAKFQIYAKKNDETKNGWLKLESGSYKLKKKANAQTWTTNSEGDISIEKLPKGYTYSIYETGTPSNCISLEEQYNNGMKVNDSRPISYSKSKGILCTMVNSDDYLKTVTINVENIKKSFDININKKDNFGNAIKGAGFKIYVVGTGTSWVGCNQDGSYNYTSEYKKAKEFTTNSKGEIDIYDLDYSKTYRVYEVSVPSDCLSLAEQVGAGMTVKVGSTIYKPEYKKTNTYEWINCKADLNYSTYNKSVTLNITNAKPTINITINKKDDENEKALSGAQFKVLATDENNKGHWLKFSNGVYSYRDNNAKEFTNNATTWTTNASGVANINNLSKNYKYTIYETKEGNGCLPLKDQWNSMTVTVNNTSQKPEEYNSTYDWIKCATIEPDGNNASQTVTIDMVNIKPKINITINKVDELGKPLEGAEFKILAIGSNDKKHWLNIGTDEKYNYNLTGDSQDFAKSHTWKVDDSGVLNIEGLSKDYNYIIYETKSADNCLSLSEQISKGMKVKVNNSAQTPVYDNTYNSIKCASITSSSSNTNQPVTISILNIEDCLDISGMIWEDHIGNKSDKNDNIYKESEDKLYTEKVTVSLMKANGNEVKTVKSVETTNDKYKIETDITITKSMDNTQIANKLNGYYLKFEYDSKHKEENSTISYYGTVAPTSGENGSKALPNKSKEIKGIAYIYKLSNYVNDTNYTFPELENMNMGLVKNEDKYEYNIEETIAYIKVKMNGYTYKYESEETENKAADAAPKIRHENGWAYKRAIYPSDIKYSIVNNFNDSSLKVYVVYRIDVSNVDPNGKSGTDKNTVNTQISYVEKSLKVKNLTNTYDTSRYKLETSYDKSTNSDFENWKPTGTTGVAEYTGTKFDNTIKPGKTRTVYIQFKVKNKEIKKLLDLKATYESKPTVATASAYHNYWKSYYSWNSDKDKSELVKADKTTQEVEKSADSIYLKLELGTEREITGKVFEDKKVSTNGEALGNGKYDSGENKIKGVKVDLLLEDKATIATVYKSNGTSYEKATATATSNNDGIYSIKGVTPGKYYVKFTYGDGTYKIVDYKSTIVTEDHISTALKKDPNGNADWYKDVTEKEHSTAVDDLAQRAEVVSNPSSRTKIDAYTALTSIGIENTKENSTTITKDDNGQKETIGEINFGIIKQPEIKLITEKVVSYIKITNTQGNVITEGNPAKEMPYVSNLDNDEHLVEGSAFVKAEINEQELYGATVNIHYSVTVQNESEINYYEENSSEYYGYYYKFGDKTHSKEVTYKVNTAYDYIDPSIKSEDVKANAPHIVEIIKEENFRTKGINNFIDTASTITGIDSSKYAYIVGITGWEEDLYSAIKTKHSEGRKTKETAILEVSRLLSANDDDFIVTNVAQAIKFNKPNNSPLVPDPDPQDPSEEVIVTVIPPTGEDTKTPLMYITISVIAGLVLVGGIVIIKKKVIDK